MEKTDRPARCLVARRGADPRPGRQRRLVHAAAQLLPDLLAGPARARYRRDLRSCRGRPRGRHDLCAGWRRGGRADHEQMDARRGAARRGGRRHGVPDPRSPRRRGALVFWRRRACVDHRGRRQLPDKAGGPRRARYPHRVLPVQHDGGRRDRESGGGRDHRPQRVHGVRVGRNRCSSRPRLRSPPSSSASSRRAAGAPQGTRSRCRARFRCSASRPRGRL